MSVATYWEVVIKARKGLFDISDPVAWWNRVVDVLDAHVLSIRPEHVAAVAGLPGLHGDPFDRIILAQAIADGFTLVTNDAMMTQYGVKTLW